MAHTHKAPLNTTDLNLTVLLGFIFLLLFARTRSFPCGPFNILAPIFRAFPFPSLLHCPGTFQYTKGLYENIDAGAVWRDTSVNGQAYCSALERTWLVIGKRGGKVSSCMGACYWKLLGEGRINGTSFVILYFLNRFLILKGTSAWICLLFLWCPWTNIYLYLYTQIHTYIYTHTIYMHIYTYVRTHVPSMLC